ncbi:MFS monocarboxylate [Cordyceps militaris]|uniref:MFS monocarboxylate n=1 Tax=Cordyceps militaris TaxID=73501 RepID=A0A2H4SCL5_CORMI|nr:MFS monocarboxylate [Cordyceps militaris]
MRTPLGTDEEATIYDKHDLVKKTDVGTIHPQDTGLHAWLFLAGSFLIEGLALGFPGAYGVFQDYYSTHPPFQTSASLLPTVSTSAMGIMYLGMPVTMGIQRLCPRLSVWSPLAGILVMAGALLGASLATTAPQLIGTQGVLFAVGSSLAYCPCIAFLNEWFDRRKGLAYGVMWAGTGLSGSVLPFALQHLLGRHGHALTLRVCAAALLVATLPVVYFVKPRLPPAAATAVHHHPFNLRFALTQTFLLHQVANVCQALGFFLPSIFLPTYARSVLGAGGVASASTILLLNLASAVGCPVMGWLSDSHHVARCLFIATVGAALATVLLWGFATTVPSLLIYCAFYGLFAGSYTSAWTGLMRQMTTDDAISDRYACKETDPVMVLSVLAAGRGIGSVLSGPLSQALVGDYWHVKTYGAYGTVYGPLVIFTGFTAALSGIVLFWKHIGWIH